MQGRSFKTNEVRLMLSVCVCVCLFVFVRLCPFKGKITFDLFVMRLTFRHHGRMLFNL